MEKRILFRHTKSTDGKRFTVAGWFDETGINLGISICGDGEQFQRVVGRNKSAGRSLASASQKGHTYVSLVSGPEKDKYWKGIEIKVFNDVVTNFENMKSSRLKMAFNLHS
jgi:hypothetical protein